MHPPPPTRRYSFAPLSIIQASASNGDSPSFGNHLTAYFFALAAAVQPFIVVGFWGLVFPFDQQCDYRCATVHGLGFGLTYLDLLLNKLTISPKLLKLVILFPFTWLLTQVLWIYSGYHPDYQVLPMDNWMSLVLSIGCMFMFCGNFYGARWLCNKRDAKWGFPGGLSGREGPPASAYFNGGGSLRF
ncbi:hypothetical protein TeGR_g248 [Tetraparma gracilis]|uniref:Uncharacterized protein n=1 Tax=Tetraparma gracilis TaxID=2962635 RepID=A0ABQ6MMZ7_9STRA|nr:hypothetical protein TeGR_g248 [Tetraparma gracilis]